MKQLLIFWAALIFMSIGQPIFSCLMFCWWLYRLEHRKT